MRSHPECTKNGLNVLLVVDSDIKGHFFGGGSRPTPKKEALYVRINCNRTEMTPIVLCTHHLYDHIILNFTFLTPPPCSYENNPNRINTRNSYDHRMLNLTFVILTMTHLLDTTWTLLTKTRRVTTTATCHTKLPSSKRTKPVDQ